MRTNYVPKHFRDHVDSEYYYHAEMGIVWEPRSSVTNKQTYIPILSTFYSSLQMYQLSFCISAYEKWTNLHSPAHTRVQTPLINFCQVVRTHTFSFRPTSLFTQTSFVAHFFNCIAVFHNPVGLFRQSSTTMFIRLRLT